MIGIHITIIILNEFKVEISPSSKSDLQCSHIYRTRSCPLQRALGGFQHNLTKCKIWFVQLLEILFSHIGRFSETFSRKPFFILIFFDFQGKVTSSKTRKIENARYMV